MVDVSKHPILNKCYEVMQAIEECGCSTEVTHAVTEAGALLDQLDALLDCLDTMARSREKLTSAVKLAYRKHHMNDNSVGWDELSTALHDALCALCYALGDGGFCKWVDTVEPMP